MNEPNVKHLETLIRMLRKQGVTEFEGHGLKLRIDAPAEKAKNGTADKVETDPEFSDEEMLLWSASGGGN